MNDLTLIGVCLIYNQIVQERSFGTFGGFMRIKGLYFSNGNDYTSKTVWLQYRRGQ